LTAEPGKSGRRTGNPGGGRDGRTAVPGRLEEPPYEPGAGCYHLIMGRTALYRDDVPFRPARAEIQLEPDTLLLHMPDGRTRSHPLDGLAASTSDGYFADRSARGSSEHIVRVPHGPAQPAPPRVLRRFVRMLVLDADSSTVTYGSANTNAARRDSERIYVITPPDHGAVAPNVVSVPEAPADAAVVDTRAWEALSDWLLCGGRLAACSISDLARLACIATPHFAVLIGEVAAQRALEHVWSATGPLRGGFDLDSALQPLVDAAKQSPRASEALVSALSHAAGAARRRRRR